MMVIDIVVVALILAGTFLGYGAGHAVGKGKR